MKMIVKNIKVITVGILLMFLFSACQMTIVRTAPDSGNTELTGSKKSWGLLSGMVETSDPLEAKCSRPEKVVFYIDPVDAALQFFGLITSTSTEVHCSK